MKRILEDERNKRSYTRYQDPFVISILVFVACYFLFIAATLDTLVKVEREELELKDQFKHKQRKLVNLQPLKQQMRITSSKFGYLHSVLPYMFDLDVVEDEVTMQADQHAIDIHTMDFAIEMPLEFYVAKNFYLIISGDFDDLYYFIYDVFYASGRAMTLGDFVIKQLNPDSILELKIQGALFRQLHEDE